MTATLECATPPRVETARCSWESCDAADQRIYGLWLIASCTGADEYRPGERQHELFAKLGCEVAGTPFPG